MSTEPKPALGITPSQTIGPFFAYALTPRAYGGSELATEQVATDGVAGERIRVEGTVYDGDGAVVSDAMIEIWQADAQGRFNASGNAGFTGFGRAETTAEGGFHFDTIMPGALAGPDGRTQAPHLSVSIFARGLLVRLATRIYFEGEAGNAGDPVLALVPAERRRTLIAKRNGQGVFRFDIRLQGEDETVFFEA
ncbi:MAG TPA: protocatechuate 3,4-dioxygenase subunit alpha [Bosea sp. (in: a-proteobacteria)]|jgi:protocatechuate 3,4-dioxygenase alpha subunit|uniref:protocatechuate 3,4-dioxygenase subunit alpha n=1 Tax=Bosea sp. (in: a-proteobacteria) TaxID=1871050 RepID=UPI002E13A28A|nr:protocatechuate 3,4-dioxygenase subunit alpha [Bosea sp. (in: a-proteobacteria)]